MKGKIVIINSKENIGKIIFDDGKESLLNKFPDIFESGDIVDVDFFKNDPSLKIQKLVSQGDKWLYGYIQIPHNINKPYGNLLITYPDMKGLIFYHKNDFSNLRIQSGSGFKTSVKFKIKKELNGKMKAVEISTVPVQEQYKCNIPKFGYIKSETSKVHMGFISEITKEKRTDKNIISGTISRIIVKNQGQDDEYCFGFITSVDADKDIYFRGDLFKNFYGTHPIENTQVFFKVINFNSGDISVKSFFQDSKIKLLDENEQYITIEKPEDNIKFNVYINQYKKIYNKEPEEGDIVNFIKEEDNSFQLTPQTDELNPAIKKNFFIPCQKTDNEKYMQGKIIRYNYDRKFGIIEDKNKQTYLFFLNQYEQLYGNGVIPKKGKKLLFVHKEDSQNGKLMVKKFGSLQSKYKCPNSSFRNFVHLEENSLYYAYTSKKQADEIFIFRPNNLSAAISLYKNQNISNEERLKAINTLLIYSYEDKKINKASLLAEKENVLKLLIDKYIASNKLQKALFFEISLQKLNYNPARLKNFNNLKSEFNIELFQRTISLNEISFDSNWNLFDIPECDISNIPPGEEYNIITDKFTINREPLDDENWKIDLSEKVPVKWLSSDEIVNI